MIFSSISSQCLDPSIFASNNSVQYFQSWSYRWRVLLLSFDIFVEPMAAEDNSRSARHRLLFFAKISPLDQVAPGFSKSVGQLGLGQLTFLRDLEN